jgi:PAS domain S-box-containing protein
MSATSWLYNLLIFGSGLLALGLAIYASRGERHSANRSFALLMLAIAEWSFSLVFANFAPNALIRLFWLAAADVGIAFCGPLWLLFALGNTGRMALLPRSISAGIIGLGGLSWLALLANGALAVWGVGISAVVAQGALLRGPLFWLHALIAYSTILAGLTALARTFLHGRSPYREQARLLLIGALVPLLVNVAYLAGPFGRAGADVTPIALAASSLLFSYAMRRYQMLTLSPIARQVVLDSMVDGLLVVDPAGRIVEHNPAAAALVGLGAGAVGRPLAEASADRSLGRALDALVADSSGDEQVITAQAAQPRYLEVTRTPLHGDAGRRLGTLLMLRDITRQTQAEEALERRAADLTTLHRVASAIGATIEPRELLPAIVAQTRDALGMSYATIGLIDTPSGDLVMTAESAGGAASLVGLRFPLRGSPFEEPCRSGEPIVIADPQHDARLAGLCGWPSWGQIRSVLVIPLRANDRLIGTLNFASVLPYSFDREQLHLAQMIAGYVAAAISNAQLFEASQQAVRTKSAILDTVSHEFRTPITAILGFTELYQEQVLGPVTDEQNEALSAVHRNARRLLRLVDDMLDLARLEAGSLDLVLHPVEVELCIKEAVALVEQQLAGRPLDIRLDLPSQLPFALADETWLRRSLVHLLTHAASLGRQVTVRAGEGHAAAGARQLVIEIADPGLSLSESEQAAIFDAFQQVPNSEADFTLSSIARMGLAISKRAIGQMDGQLTLRSALGGGGTFTVTLRAAELAIERSRT